MIEYEIEQVEQKYPKKIKCDVCKKEFDCEKDVMEIQEFCSIRRTGGYISVFGDGSEINCDICQHCLEKMLGEYLVINSEDCF